MGSLVTVVGELGSSHRGCSVRWFFIGRPAGVVVDVGVGMEQGPGLAVAVRDVSSIVLVVKGGW